MKIYAAIQTERWPFGRPVRGSVLTLPDGIPSSEVLESYTANVLRFPVPGP